MSHSPRLPTQPAHYAEIEAVLVLFATQVDTAELRRVLVKISHPAAAKAVDLLTHGRPAGAEAVLEDALEDMAGPATGTRLGWFKPHAHQSTRRSPTS